MVESLVCKKSATADFIVGHVYHFTNSGVVDSKGNVWLGYTHGPHNTHLENMNSCYGFVEFETIKN